MSEGGEGRGAAVTAAGGRSVAGGSFHGVVGTGDHMTVVQVPPGELRPVAEVDAPGRLVSLPARHPGFVGRVRELAALDEAFGAAGTVVVQALHGLGGIGKSTLAARWAAGRAENPVWWITADSPAALDAGLAALAAALQPALAHLPAEQLTERAVQWLGAHRDWLLVLDNVAEPADVAPLLARVAGGRVLITSRRSSGWHDVATPLGLDVLSPAESLALLGRITGEATAADGGPELCAELGHLPLAVEQAGAYVAETGIGVPAYLRLLAEHPAEMYGETAEGRDGDRTVARVWRITLDRIARSAPLAGTLLRTVAWWAPDGIPRTFLAGLGTPIEVNRAIGRLAAYSMITTGGDHLAVHRLVQAVARTPDPQDPHRRAEDIEAALRTATAVLEGRAPRASRDPGGWPHWRALLPHVDALARCAPAGADTYATARLLNEAALFLKSRGEYVRAVPHLERALGQVVRSQGGTSVPALMIRNNLAAAYQDVGDLARAVPLLEGSLADREQVFGEDHPGTLTARNNLATAYRDAGDLARAVALFERNLADGLRVLGEEHLDVFVLRNNLALVYGTTGDLGRAMPLHERNLADRVRVLGEDHPDTLMSCNNLAYVCWAAGEYGRAVSLLRRAATGMTRVLGEEHPYARRTRANLARALRDAPDPGSVQDQVGPDAVAELQGVDAPGGGAGGHPAEAGARDGGVEAGAGVGDGEAETVGGETGEGGPGGGGAVAQGVVGEFAGDGAQGGGEGVELPVPEVGGEPGVEFAGAEGAGRQGERGRGAVHRGLPR
ncbi:tetratricopeptide repeat protein [Kitasatospora sp. NPDC088391]|uniref:tetratricopeptide repeat protein n=1 Tax=Kitasatospora sp. NPDC088391 TaxID=3364074 RepID=UPI0037F13660